MLAGDTAGLVSVLGVFVMALLYVRHQRAMGDLRRWAGNAPERGRDKHRSLSSAVASPAPWRPWRPAAVVGVVGAATISVLGVIALTSGESRTGRAGSATGGHAQRRVDDMRDLSRRYRAQVPVAILNGSSTAGLAARTQQRLTALGFAQDVVGTAPQATSAKTVAYADQDATGPARAIARLIHAGPPVRADPTQHEVARRAEVIVTLGGAGTR